MGTSPTFCGYPHPALRATFSHKGRREELPRRYLMLSADLTTLTGVVTIFVSAAWVWPVNVVAS